MENKVPVYLLTNEKLKCSVHFSTGLISHVRPSLLQSTNSANVQDGRLWQMHNIIFLSFLDFSVRRKGHANQTRNSFQEEPLCNGNQVKLSLCVTKTSTVTLWLTYISFFLMWQIPLIACLHKFSKDNVSVKRATKKNAQLSFKTSWKVMLHILLPSF